MKQVVAGVLIFLALLGGLYYLDNNIIKNITMEEENNVPLEELMVNQLKERQKDQQEIGIRRGNIAANFSLKNLAGQEENLTDYRGKKVVLNFWSTDCPACVEEMPALNDFYLEYKDQEIVVLGVNLGESSKVVADFMEKNNYQFPILLDEKVAVGFSYGIIFTPTTFFINEDGVIVDLHIGALTLEDLHNRYQ
ncbi:TlpA disulfide reductase family protein [Alkaliphilus transvaalensis]|uniref:TlpA disulfide reductase family protein n=1 Tax=Alkaliphilus transvaalensis TaxID=114628 RepID=UPI0006888AB0|nr:TlpA disulfide reductase family protein [Alkaliphilus transvaalensis]